MNLVVFGLILILGVVHATALNVCVLDAASRQTLAGASVVWRIGEGRTNTVAADAAGRVKVPIPRRATGPVRITASKQGFVPMAMRWEAGKVPAKFDLRLAEAQTIGGRVTDQLGQPVAGADITLILPERLAGPRVALEDYVVRSDADGRWRSSAVPKDAAYISVEVSHPSFASPQSEVTLEALRAGTAEFKLSAVTTLRGLVLDDTGRPVPEAEIALGMERDIWPSRSTLEARTDAAGRFEFQRVRLEKRLLGVYAPAFAPAMKLVEIKRDAAPIEIRLQRGKPLRVRVVDHDGQPIVGLAAKVNEWPSGLHSGQDSLPGRWAYPGWEWETDAEGRLTWSNAPPQMVLWSFTKGGYMSLGSHGLTVSTEEQVVKLGPPFRLRGSVTDAVNGQPVTEFVVTPRFVQINASKTHTNFGGWYEYQRKQFSGGKFSLYYEYPLLAGTPNMPDWQFRVEADGYEPLVSRIVRDEERGLQLDLQLTPRPLPEIVLPAPTGTKRVTVAAAVQPTAVRPGDTLTLFVKAGIAAGHHIYALEDSGCSNLPTALDAALRNVLTPDGPWRGPEPKINQDGSRTLAGELWFKRRFLVGSSANSRTYQLPITLRFQVCNEALCWPPETISLETQFQVLPPQN